MRRLQERRSHRLPCIFPTSEPIPTREPICPSAVWEPRIPLTQNDSSHSETVGFSASGSILSFSGGSVSISINTSQSSNTNQINFRDGCQLTLTVNYAETAGVSTGSVTPSSAVLGSTFTLNITSSANTYHTVSLTLGSYSASYNMGTNVKS